MTKELESALYACVRYLLQVRAHAMEDAGQSEARDEALGYLETLHEAYLKGPRNAEDTARRRSQGAKDGWEIRRAKERKE